MKLSLLVSLVVVVGCGNKDKECAAKRKVAADEVVNIEPDVNMARDSAKDAVEDATNALGALDGDPEDLEKILRLVEQSMDCLVHSSDCCKRVAKFDNHQQLGIGSSVDLLWEGPEHPAEVAAVMEPLRTIIDRHRGGSPTPKELETWCTEIRGDIARVRKDVPAAWKSARDKATAEIAVGKAKLEAAKANVATVGAWAEAIRKNQKAAVTPQPEADQPFQRVEKAVVAYNAACHQ